MFQPINAFKKGDIRIKVNVVNSILAGILYGIMVWMMG